MEAVFEGDSAEQMTTDSDEVTAALAVLPDPVLQAADDIASIVDVRHSDLEGHVRLVPRTRTRDYAAVFSKFRVGPRFNLFDWLNRCDLPVDITLGPSQSVVDLLLSRLDARPIGDSGLVLLQPVDAQVDILARGKPINPEDVEDVRSPLETGKRVVAGMLADWRSRRSIGRHNAKPNPPKRESVKGLGKSCKPRGKRSRRNSQQAQPAPPQADKASVKKHSKKEKKSVERTWAMVETSDKAHAARARSMMQIKKERKLTQLIATVPVVYRGKEYLAGTVVAALKGKRGHWHPPSLIAMTILMQFVPASGDGLKLLVRDSVRMPSPVIVMPGFPLK
jgi:hypothetical protein